MKNIKNFFLLVCAMLQSNSYASAASSSNTSASAAQQKTVRFAVDENGSTGASAAVKKYNTPAPVCTPHAGLKSDSSKSRRHRTSSHKKKKSTSQTANSMGSSISAPAVSAQNEQPETILVSVSSTEHNNPHYEIWARGSKYVLAWKSKYKDDYWNLELDVQATVQIKKEHADPLFVAIIDRVRKAIFESPFLLARPGFKTIWTTPASLSDTTLKLEYAGPFTAQDNVYEENAIKARAYERFVYFLNS